MKLLKCAHCGFETDLESFFRTTGRRPMCVPCFTRRYHSTIRAYPWWTLLLWSITGATWLLDPFLGTALFGAAFLVVCTPAALVLHELGHAVAAALTGAQVFRIIIGSGPEKLRFRLGAWSVVVRAIPLRGVVLVGTRPFRRWAEALILAGGAFANAVGIALSICMVVWLPRPLAGLGFLLFAVANAFLLVVALWPRMIFQEVGPQLTDGLMLWKALFRPDEFRTLRGASYHAAAVYTSFDDEDFVSALEACEDGLLDMPDDVALRSLRAATLISLDRSSEALPLLRELVALEFPAYLRPINQTNLAFLCLLEDPKAHLEEAEAMSREAVALLALLPVAVGNHGMVLVELGRLAEGLKLLEVAARFADRPSQLPSLLAYRAIACARSGAADRARELLEAAVEADPEHPLVRRAAGDRRSDRAESSKP